MARGSVSPEKLSGAGYRYELFVRAWLLTDLLLGHTAEGLGPRPVAVFGSQRSDFFVMSEDGCIVVYDARLAVDARRDRLFRRIIFKAVDDWESRPDELNDRRRHYCVVARSFSRELTSLVTAARSYHGPTEEFVERIASQREHRRWWKSLRSTVESANAADLDEAAFRVLRNLVVWRLDDSPGRGDELRLQDRLREAGYDDPMRTLESLKALADQFAGSGSVLTADELRMHLAAEYDRRASAAGDAAGDAPAPTVGRGHQGRRLLGGLIGASALCLPIALAVTSIVSQSAAARATVPIKSAQAEDRGRGEIRVTWKAERGASYIVYTRAVGAAEPVEPVSGSDGMATVYVNPAGGYCFKIWGSKLNAAQMESAAISIRGADCSKAFPADGRRWLDD